MELSVIVVSYNTRELLDRCLSSVYSTVRGLNHEVIVVDNGSVDGSPELVASSFPQATLICNRANRGFAGANNQAIGASSGRHILLLNSDAALLDDAARLMAGFLDTHPGVGAIGGRLLNPDGSFQSSYMDFPGLLAETLLLTGLSRCLFPTSYPSYPESKSRQCRQADWVSGAFLMCNRKALDVVGLLDESYFMYTEEMDLCYRMKRHGWSVYYLPEAQAVHSAGGSSRLVPECRRAQLYRSKWLFMLKHRGRPRATIYRLLVRAMSIAKLLMWLLAGLTTNKLRRTYARQNVASYRFLLGHM